MAKRSARQAVLLIHGVGEPRPMQALRGFVDAVWKSDESVHHEYSVATVWSKPDTVSKSFELRRLTTGQNKSNVVTDFFELYWAHLMPGTTLGHVLSWARILLVRWPWKVPRALLGVWLLLVMAALAAGFLLLQSVLPEEYVVLAIPKWASGLAGALLTALVIPVINNVGDAARYLNAAPSNIQRRHEIRVNGVKVLEELHRSGHYERIIVVGQGLGSVIAYDILTYAWALHYRERDDQNPWPLGAQNDLEQMAVAGDIQVDEYQKRQREYLSELQSGGNTWLVTDLLTLGCPLAHAAILLADDRADLERKKDDRELPTCPPVLEDGRFSFPPKSKTRVPHHAAVFPLAGRISIFRPGSYFGAILSAARYAASSEKGSAMFLCGPASGSGSSVIRSTGRSRERAKRPNTSRNSAGPLTCWTGRNRRRKRCRLAPGRNGRRCAKRREESHESQLATSLGILPDLHHPDRSGRRDVVSPAPADRLLRGARRRDASTLALALGCRLLLSRRRSGSLG